MEKKGDEKKRRVGFARMKVPGGLVLSLNVVSVSSLSRLEISLNMDLCFDFVLLQTP